MGHLTSHDLLPHGENIMTKPNLAGNRLDEATAPMGSNILEATRQAWPHDAVHDEPSGHVLEFLARPLSSDQWRTGLAVFADPAERTAAGGAVVPGRR